MSGIILIWPRFFLIDDYFVCGVFAKFAGSVDDKIFL